MKRKLTIPLSPGTYRRFAEKTSKEGAEMAPKVRGWIDGFVDDA